jgi:arylsulfatase A-like enzyme
MATPDHPNVLLVMSDEHAPQYSSVYGHPIVVRRACTAAAQLPQPASQSGQAACLTALG